MLNGIDISAIQGRIDWPLVARAVSFAWVKATEGSTVMDARFAENWSGALYAGVPRGAYHFFTSGSTGRAQAEAFLRIYPGGGELPPVLDLERGLDGSAPQVEEALRWIEIIREELGVAPMIYVSPSFAVEHCFAEHQELAASDLWIAHWDPEHGPPLVAPTVPKPWATWRARQRGKGRCAGITGSVDLDVMRG